MLKIRFNRTGKSAQPNFRIVVQEHTAPIGGKFIETLGYFRPTTKDKDRKINVERVKYWISVGACPSDSVAVLLKQEGLTDMEKYMEPRNRKKKSKKAPAEEPQAQAAPTAAEPAPAEAVAEAEVAQPAPAAEAPAPEAEVAEPAPAEPPKEEAPAPRPPAEEPQQSA